MKLQKLLKKVRIKEETIEKYWNDKAVKVTHKVYDSHEINALSISIDEEKARIFLRGHKLFTKDGYDKWINSGSFRDALAKAMAEANTDNILTVRREE